MGAITDWLNSWLREYVIDGSPSSGPNKPVKSEGRAGGPIIEAAIADAAYAGAVQYVVPTLTELLALAGVTNGQFGYVFANSDVSLGGLYVYSTSTSPTGWQQTDFPYAYTLEQVVSTVQPLVDEAAASAAAADASADAAATAATATSATERWYTLYKQIVIADVDATNQIGTATFLDGSQRTFVTTPAGTFDRLTVDGREERADERWYVAQKQILDGDVDATNQVGAAIMFDGTVYPSPDSGVASALPDITCWGDSLTAATFPAALQTLTGRTVNNKGIGGQRSFQIAGRMGATSHRLTLASNTVSAGSNSVTHIDGAAIDDAATLAEPNGQFLTTGSANTTYSVTGNLGSVHGTLTRTASGGPPSTSETYTFTPDATGQVVPKYVPPETAFLVDNDLDEDTTILWLGRNNVADTTQVEADIAACVARLRHERFVIMGVINGSGANEQIGGSVYISIRTLENDLADLYPRNFLNIRRLLIDRGLDDAIISPTALDLLDIADDIVPDSLRIDSLHLTTAGYALVAGYINDFLTAKGW